MRFFALLVVIVSFSFSCIEPQSKVGGEFAYEKVDYGQFKQLYSEDTASSIILDVRTLKEYSAGHIDGAINIDYFDNQFKSNLMKLDTSKTVFVYCHSGGRSGQASKTLKVVGFKKVYDLKGGFSRIAR